MPQSMGLSDDIAYSVHDVEDGIRDLAGSADLFDDSTARRSWPRPGLVRALRGARTWRRLSRHIVSMPVWLRSMAPTPPSHLKDATGRLIGRFCSATRVARARPSGCGRWALPRRPRRAARVRAEEIGPSGHGASTTSGETRAVPEAASGGLVDALWPGRTLEPVFAAQWRATQATACACARSVGHALTSVSASGGSTPTVRHAVFAAVSMIGRRRVGGHR